MKYFILLFSIAIIQSGIGQCKLTIIQEGNKAQLMNEPAVYSVNSYPSQSQKINDSTIVYTLEDITEPTYLFILIDSKRHGDTSLMHNWRTRIWIAPEAKQRELIINYPAKAVKYMILLKEINP